MKNRRKQQISLNPEDNVDIAIFDDVIKIVKDVLFFK